MNILQRLRELRCDHRYHPMLSYEQHESGRDRVLVCLHCGQNARLQTTVGSHPKCIEAGGRLYARFENERKKTKNKHVPAMDQETFLSALLDTHDAVRRGYYDG